MQIYLLKLIYYQKEEQKLAYQKNRYPLVSTRLFPIVLALFLA